MRSLFLLAAALVGAAAAQTPPPVRIERSFLGSGQPEQAGYENATAVTNDVYHAPQYLPGSPTAATIWPRVVEVPCSKGADGSLLCSGYHWLPSYGRAEYLYFRPVLAPPADAPAAMADPADAVALRQSVLLSVRH